LPLDTIIYLVILILIATCFGLSDRHLAILQKLNLGTNKMHQCIKFILFHNDNLHVSNGLSVHHQEFKTVHTATGISQTDSAVCLQADSTICLRYACCSMYSLELLMMDGKTVRNM